MRRKMMCLLLTVLSLFSSCGLPAEPAEQTKDTQSKPMSAAHDELRAVWLTVYEISNMAKGKTKDEYTANVCAVLQKIKSFGLGTVFFQVRAFSDALYDSALFPASRYLTGEEGKKADFDALGIFVACAKEAGISVHAWINPLRVSYDTKVKSLSQNNPAYLLWKASPKGEDLLICDKGIYYNPASAKARKVILDGIREILDKYDVAGIQFDDYFYPVTEKMGDEKYFEAYQKNGGTLSVSDWRRENVTNLMASVYALIKAKNEKLVFGISPAAKFSYDSDSLYADVQMWSVKEGYVDYICPQIYFGFENEAMPFEKVLASWEKLLKGSSVKLYCGLAVYKAGKEDRNAGTGKSEWLENKNILAQQFTRLQKSEVCRGFVLFSYSYLFNDNLSDIAKTEINCFADVLK